MKKEIIVIDRSRDESWSACPRQYYWGYVYDKTGIIRSGKPLYFAVGDAVHKGIQSSMCGDSWAVTRAVIEDCFMDVTLTEDLKPLLTEQQQEQVDLAVALVYVWRRERMPLFLQEYRPLLVNGEPLIEQEIVVTIYETDEYEVKLMCRPDVIVERISDGAVLDWELKTVGVANERWIRKWPHQLQLLLQVYATRYLLANLDMKERPVVGIVVDGLVKGQRKKDKKTGIKRQECDLIYAYTKKGDGFIVKDQFQKAWKKDWSKLLVSQHYPGGVEGWINRLTMEDVLEHVRTIPPIMTDEDTENKVLVQVGEKAIRRRRLLKATDVEQISTPYWLDVLYPQNFQTCDEMDGCPFQDCCFMHNIGEAPLESGLYEKREPNHLYEKEE